MAKNAQKACTYELQQQKAGTAVLVLRGRLDFDTTGSLFKKIQADRRLKKQSALTIDLDQVDHLDDFGALLLNNLSDTFKASDRKLLLVNASPQIQAILELADFEGLATCALPQRRVFRWRRWHSR